eukprot:scaffold7153_cov115-Isochrysis_galbana.AAC.6
MVTSRSTSSAVSSPALSQQGSRDSQHRAHSRTRSADESTTEVVQRGRAGATAHRLERSTSAFLQQMFEKRRPTPLMEVRANITLTLPSRLVLSTRKMCWKLDSFMMSAMAGRACVRRADW